MLGCGAATTLRRLTTAGARVALEPADASTLETAMRKWQQHAEALEAAVRRADTGAAAFRSTLPAAPTAALDATRHHKVLVFRNGECDPAGAGLLRPCTDRCSASFSVHGDRLGRKACADRKDGGCQRRREEERACPALGTEQERARAAAWRRFVSRPGHRFCPEPRR